MDRDSAFAPRIYYLHPLLLGPLQDWTPHLDRAAALGFDHLLIAPPFLTGSADDIFVTQDHQRLHPLLQDDGHTNDWLRRLAGEARARGMSLMLDIVLDRISIDAGLHRDHPDWYRPPGGPERRVDPRSHPHQESIAYAHFADPEAADHLIDWWSQQLRSYAEAGVVGFRLDSVRGIPSHVWRRLAAAARERHPLQRFLAWTPGLSRDELASLEDAGFDAVFSSIRWWDFRADWMIEEQAALSRVATPIGFPEAPFGTRLAMEPSLATAAEPIVERAYRRALQIAVAGSTGWLLPMGFEFGATAALPIDASQSSGALATAFSRAVSAPRFDLQADIVALNHLLAGAPVLGRAGVLSSLTGPDASATALLRTAGADPRRAPQALLIVANPDLAHTAVADAAHFLAGVPGEFTLFAPLAPVAPGTDASTESDTEPDLRRYAPLPPFLLSPGEIRLFEAHRSVPIVGIDATGKRPSKAAEKKTTIDAIRVPRIAIESVTPAVEGGRFPAKRVVGERVQIEADVFMDGHDKIAAVVLWRAKNVSANVPANTSAQSDQWQELPMHAIGNDRWAARLPLTRLGAYEFTIEAWRDTYATLADHIEKKQAAKQDVALEIEEARLLFERIVAEHDTGDVSALQAVVKSFARASAARKIEIVLSDDTAAAVAASRHRDFRVRHTAAPTILAERSAAAFANWYELFPRSQSGDLQRHGTFIDVISRLPAVSAMGFDVLYFPPIHPIGLANRKGPNNTLTPGPTDVGSPYAIGSADGGHTAIHPELGSFDDFKSLMTAARAHGLEIALDFAIQCSPDHPWLKQHPGWFAWRPDGSLRYAENPPKKYQDIVNPDFYADDAVPALWLELRDVILFWIGTGVDIFRVDNPHTKPLPFWEWMIGEIRRRHPQVIFLSEAFTRPKVMNRLAKVGFSQSYTYFTWRETKQDFVDYMTELTQTPVRDYFRPNFFVNTPDINPRFLQRSGRAGFVLRAALAATLAGVWGVYSGFELCEATPMPNSEEYLDCEKYQIRRWDWERPGNIIGEITLLNRIRRANPALHSHLGVSFLPSSNPNLLFFEKATENRDNVLLIAISLVPEGLQESSIELPLWQWGLADHDALQAQDLVSGERFEWRGKYQTIRIDPQVMPFAIRRVSAPGRVAALAQRSLEEHGEGTERREQVPHAKHR